VGGFALIALGRRMSADGSSASAARVLSALYLTCVAALFALAVAPAVAIAWGQILLGVVVAVPVFGLRMPTNPALVVAAVGGGTAVFVLLALVSAGLTRTVHLAELTTTPVLVASLALSGLMLPVEQLPGLLGTVAQMLPLTPVVTLVRLGLTGTTGNGQVVDLSGSFVAAVVPLLVLAAWVAVGLWLARRWFRWEPRR